MRCVSPVLSPVLSRAPKLLSCREPIVGTSAAWRAALQLAKQVAPEHATVLVTGETGSGKAVIAQVIHDAGPRAAAALVRVNCAALTGASGDGEPRLHRRGGPVEACCGDAFGALDAFTGAAALGTLLLDEIGDMPLALQPQLLRLLADGEAPANDSAGVATRTSFRVIATTHKDLRQEVAAGRFRADLYYRLASCVIQVPALRERDEDVAALARHFLGSELRRLGHALVPLSADALARLREYHWPGNARELRNTIRRACATSVDGRLCAKDFQLPVNAPVAVGLTPAPTAAPATANGFSQGLHNGHAGRANGDCATRIPTLREVERRHIELTLQLCKGVVEGRHGAAALLGLPASTTRFRMKKHGIVASRVAATMSDDSNVFSTSVANRARVR